MQKLSTRLDKFPVVQKLIPLFTFKNLSWIIIGFGILVRLIQYLYNRSLWADEAVLALNIVNRTYGELLQPLDYDQGAPIGFLFVEKLAIQLFGNTEYALRLFPLISGIVSLFLFYRLAKRFLLPPAIPIALVLFASLPHLVYYASEVKQYSSDVMVALLCCLISLRVGNPKLTMSQVLTIGIIGAIAIWFSHPAIFILAGIADSTLFISWFKKDRLKITNILLILFTWLVSFIGFYFVSIKDLSSSQDLLESWGSAFPSSPFDIIWLLDAFGKFFYRPLGFTAYMDGLAILAFAIGCFACFHRNRKALLILLSPLLVTFFAAYLHKYPFRSRLVLFLTPFVILLIAEGVNYLKRRNSNKLSAIAGFSLAILLLFTPLTNATQLLVKPELREEIKIVLNYVKAHEKPGDVLYVFQRGVYQFQYYAQKYGYQKKDYIIGVDDLDKVDGNKSLTEAEWQRYKADLDKLRGNRRVWLLFSHANVRSENEKIKAYLDSIGKQTDFFDSPGSFVYLYDLSADSKSTAK